MNLSKQTKSGEPQGWTDGVSAGLVFSQGVVLGSAGRAIYPRRPGAGGGGCSHADGGQRHCDIAQEAFEERGTPRHQETQPPSFPSEQLLLSHGKCWDQGRLPELNLLPCGFAASCGLCTNPCSCWHGNLECIFLMLMWKLVMPIF